VSAARSRLYLPALGAWFLVCAVYMGNAFVLGTLRQECECAMSVVRAELDRVSLSVGHIVKPMQRLMAPRPTA